LSVAETTFAVQAVVLVVVLVSMAFRMKGNYLVHGITMIVAVVVELLGTFANIPSLMDSSITQAYTSPSWHLAVVAPHMVLAISTLVFGVWLVALWRPHSTTFAVKSKRIAQLTTVLWVVTFLLGVLVFVTLHTTLFA